MSQLTPKPIGGMRLSIVWLLDETLRVANFRSRCFSSFGDGSKPSPCVRTHCVQRKTSGEGCSWGKSGPVCTGETAKTVTVVVKGNLDSAAIVHTVKVDSGAGGFLHSGTYTCPSAIMGPTVQKWFHILRDLLSAVPVMWHDGGL